jgi:hypothetical protein
MKYSPTDYVNPRVGKFPRMPDITIRGIFQDGGRSLKFIKHIRQFTHSRNAIDKQKYEIRYSLCLPDKCRKKVLLPLSFNIEHFC